MRINGMLERLDEINKMLTKVLDDYDTDKGSVVILERLDGDQIISVETYEGTCYEYTLEELMLDYIMNLM